MRGFLFVISIVLFLVSCQADQQQQKLEMAKNYTIYGDTIIVANTSDLSDVKAIYKELAQGDTITTKMTATVTDVCKKKGCWLKLDLNQDQQVMVRFKDYSFFVPEDLIGKEVVLQGNAYVEQLSVDDQQHYAMDGGKSEAEIAAITEPKNTFSFLANGVLTKK